MRAKPLLVGGLALLLGACSGKPPHAPPLPPDKQLLVGKWKNGGEGQFLTGYEFAGDGTLQVTFEGLAKPLPGRYAWKGDRDLDLKYQPGEEERKAYRAAAQAYKDRVRDRIARGELSDRAGPSILASARDELPAEETFRVGLNDKPRILILTGEGGNSQTFEKAD